MLKTRVQTVLYMLMAFSLISFFNSTILWFTCFSTIALLIAYEWKNLPKANMANVTWADLWNVQGLTILFQAIFLAIAAYLLFFLSMSYDFSQHNWGLSLIISAVLKCVSVLWLVLCIVMLKMPANQLREKLNTKTWQKLMFTYVPNVLPVFLILNVLWIWSFLPSRGPIAMIVLIFGVVWLSDTLAYFAGKKWGKHKLAPEISPNKTWEGALIGTFAAALLIFLIHGLENNSFDILNLFKFYGLAILSALGDLFQSKLKRVYHVKDSSQLLPGHGGFFDRFDAMIPVVLFAAWLS